jgi:hypothetical protein
MAWGRDGAKHVRMETRRAQHIALSQGAFISIGNKVAFALIKPYVHGLVGTEAYNWLMPRNFDWSEVSVGTARRFRWSAQMQRTAVSICSWT